MEAVEVCEYCGEIWGSKCTCCGECHFKEIQVDEQNDEKEEPIERIVQILASNEVDDGIIDQNLYDFLVEVICEKYKLKKKQARSTVTNSLRQLYVVAPGVSYG